MVAQMAVSLSHSISDWEHGARSKEQGAEVTHHSLEVLDFG